MSSIDKFIGMEFRSRYVNPTWIEGMQEEGYAGANQMRAFFQYMWGWDATVSATVDDSMWDETFDVYVQDKHELGIKDFFDSESPFAYQDITARMMETIRKGYWDAEAETLSTLVQEYIDSVNEHGVGCSENTCANPRLLEYVVEQAAIANVPVPDVEAFRAAMEEAIRGSIEELAEIAAEFARQNDARLLSREVPGPEALVPLEQPPADLQGYRMERVGQDRIPSEPTSQSVQVRNASWGALWLALAVLGFLLTWRWRRARA